MAKQTAMIEAGERKHAQMESDIYSGAGEQFQRKMFNLTLTQRQGYGLRVTQAGFGGCDLKTKKKILYSACCKAEAKEYRSISYGGGKPVERFYRCKECYHDCELRVLAPRK